MKAAIGIYAGMGLLVILICVPMILEMVPPNNWYGFRTRRTVSDPEVWYPANRIAGQYLAVAGTVIVLTTLLVFLFQKSLPPNTASIILLSVSLISILGASVMSLIALRRI